MNYWMRILSLAVAFHLVVCNVNAEEGKKAIQKGDKVSFDYTLTIDDKVADTSKGKEPLQYTHGQGQIIPGLEKELIGMHIGEEKAVKVVPQEGYGEINPKAYREIPKNSLPPEVKAEAGMTLAMKGPQGQVVPVKISEVKEQSVVLDLNHPLAGKVLNFQVKIVDIK